MIRIPSAGGYSKMEYLELPEGGHSKGANVEGTETGNCVMVETHACGVNYADICIRLGIYKSATEFVGWPITPGFEFSGVISEVGGNVKRFKKGDQVFGLTLFGGYSQSVLVPESQIHKAPENITLSEAGGILCTSATAWYAVHELCKLRKGDVVLVHSAAGGVGTMLVQMLKKIRCTVVGVVGREHKVAAIKGLGCDHVIDKSKENLWERAKEISDQGYKAIFDANGIETLQKSFDHLAPGGRLISYGFTSMLPRSTESSDGKIGLWDWMKIGVKYRQTPTFCPLQMTTQNKSVMAFNLSYMFNETKILQEFFEDLYQWISDGSIKLPHVTEYPLKNVGKAHRDLESGNTIGKLILLTRGNEESSLETGEI